MKTKMGRKTTTWILQRTNKGSSSQDNLDMAMKGKPKQRKWIIVNSHPKEELIMSQLKLIMPRRIASTGYIYIYIYIKREREELITW